MSQPLRKDDQGAEPRLGRVDWITAAMALLIDEGIDAVRITRLAENLSVTRGSFYWHFKDRDDLLAALRRGWEQRNTPAVQEAVENADTLAEGVLGIFDAWLIAGRFDAQLDHAMRAWAKTDPDIAAAVDDADRIRIGEIAAMFETHGFEDDEALIRARVLYFAQIGFYALGEHEPLSERSPYLETYFQCFTGRTLDPAIAAEFRAKHGVTDHGPQ